ncbi:energy-coupling factor transporter transmembrane component T family protein [Candidatus Contubernalis alkaliaceticus]|uniref:energy-coupling factor transporter transmembrane component T family protein n=1 Tax=Candidatus Contubernalis alkaliaceticus TaxID=338645 RepID=UPI001F4C0388|nr:energy-coupling factor transporter transmembrane component T [Candidatus Contubernalis alkalaceticus]UNC90967.1 energy-coupling factor transporter transmembrane protein EcfT [Candidatus Contubernalis alkalaceticus]
MIKDITMGQYYPAKSLLHDLDPRMKIVLLFFYMVLIFFVKTFYGFFFIGIITLGMIKGSRLPVRFFLKSLRPILIIISFTLFLHAFFTKGGEVLLSIGPLTVEADGLVTGLFMTLRLIILVITTSLLTLTTSPIALTDGIEYLLSPLKKIGVPAHEVAMMMTISLRFIPILILESDKIMKAQLARGADFNRGSIVERARNMIPLMVPLFVSAFRRADELASAMEARCYRGGEGRTRLHNLQLSPRDYYALTFVASVFMLFIVTGL